MPGRRTQELTDTAFALLELPDPAELSEAQRRGQTCVWDAFGFDPATVVRFGTRTWAAGAWYPSAHRGCVPHIALASLRDHAVGCEQCVADANRCETAGMFVLLVEEYTR